MINALEIPVLFTGWVVILYTVLMQFAVGSAFFASVLTAISEGLEAGLKEAIEEREVRKKLWRASFFLFVIALALASIHGQTSFAILLDAIRENTFNTSLLTAENSIGLILLFFLLIQIVKSIKGLGYLTSFLALVFVYVLAKSITSAMPLSLWNTVGALTAFYGTVFVLGGAFSLWTGRNLETSYFKKYAAFALVVGILCSISSKASFIASFLSKSFIVSELDFDTYIIIAQAILVILGLLCMLPKRNAKSFFILALGMICFLLAEIFSRILFLNTI